MENDQPKENDGKRDSDGKPPVITEAQWKASLFRALQRAVQE